MRVISGIVAGLFCLSVVGAAPPQSIVEIPFDFRTKQPIVPVKVNGGPAVPFVVDTGASIHVIDRELARQVKIAGGRAARMNGGGQAAVDVQFVDGLSIETAGRSWGQQRAAVAPLGYPDKKHFAGLIGAPILMRYTVEFNFHARTLRLLDPATYTPPRSAVIVPFELQDNLPVVRVTIEAGSAPIEARLMVDTGASTFLDVNRPFVDAHRLVEALADATPDDRPAAIGGTAPFLYGTAQRVRFGGHTFERPRLGLSRATTGSSSRGERDGVIGNELLRRWVMTVDYARQRIALTQP